MRRLGRIVEALLSMTGRVTMLGLSRWTVLGGSYRTVQRFFTTTVVWGQVHWLIIRHHLLEQDDVLVLGGDEVVVSKSGKKTHGLDRFFSSLYGKAVPGLCFLSISLISVKRRASYPVLMEPVVKEAIAGSPKAVKRPAKGEGGRPKGSRNRNRREVELSPYLRFVQGLMRQVLTRLGSTLRVSSFVFDGAFGHHSALQMVRQTGDCNSFPSCAMMRLYTFPMRVADGAKSMVPSWTIGIFPSATASACRLRRVFRRRFTRCRWGTNASPIYSISWSS